jgi:hypothetical protein
MMIFERAKPNTVFSFRIYLTQMAYVEHLAEKHGVSKTKVMQNMMQDYIDRNPIEDKDYVPYEEEEKDSK